MRIVLLIALVAFPAAAQQVPVFDADLDVGISKSTNEVYGAQIAPSISLRLGARPFEWLSLGIRGEAVPGPEGAAVAFNSGMERAGQKWFAASVDVRLILTSPHEVYLSGGFGIGHMVSLQCQCQEIYETHGSGKPVAQIAAGVRAAVDGPLRLGGEIRAVHFGDLEWRGAVDSPPPPLPPVQETQAWLLLLTLTLGLSL